MKVQDISTMIKIPEKDKRAVDVFVLNQEEWDIFILDLNKYFQKTEDIALTIIRGPEAIIVVNKDMVPKDLWTIVLGHEYGHIMRGTSEEDADTYAIEEIVSDDDAEKLIEMWPLRHGRTYGESTIWE